MVFSAQAMVKIYRYFLSAARWRRAWGSELWLRAGEAMPQEDGEGRNRYRAGFQY
jgi:hypothetical protein